MSGIVKGDPLSSSRSAPVVIPAAGFDSGTKMVFNQTAAPTGSGDDHALRLTTGTVGTGGSVAFETAFASQTVPVHTLATSEIPAHTHSYEQRQAGVYAASGWAGAIHDSGANSTTTSSSTGGGGSHGHGSIDLNVSYVDVIIATKD